MAVFLNIACPLISLAILLLCSAFFACSETAYTSLTRIQVRQISKEKNSYSKKIAYLKSDMDRLITTVLTGTNFINTLASSITTAFAVNVFGSQYVTYATAIMTVLIIIFCEIIPKTLASVKTIKVAKKSAGVLIFVQKILFPVVWFFNQITKFIEFVEKKNNKKEMPLVTEEELKTLIDVGKNEGTLEENEKLMLNRIFEFTDLHVHDILKHRSLVVSIDINSTCDEVIKKFTQSGFSRLPVYKDTPENIVGILHYKSVLFASNAILKSKDFVRNCMRSVLFVPESLTGIELLQKFKKEHATIAIAVDEYGSSSGLVTMNDVLRAVFGRIIDDSNANIISPEKRIKVLNTKEFIVPGDMKLDDVNEVLKMNLDSEEYDTLAGWLLEKIGELPSTGAVYKNGGTVFTIEDQSARRIQSVKIRLA